MTRPIRVLIVDDDALVRSGLKLLLRGAPGIEVIAEVGDGGEVLGALDRHHPDVVLLDLRMPKLDGLAVLGLMRTQPRPTPVIVLTTFDTDEHVLRALRLGAAGFLVKDTPPEEIVRAIELVAEGDSMLSPGVTRRLIERLAADGDAAADRDGIVEQLAGLSPRDREIAEAVAEGKPNAVIASDLHLSIATIKSRVSAMLMRLRLDNRVQLALLIQTAGRKAREGSVHQDPSR